MKCLTMALALFVAAPSYAQQPLTPKQQELMDIRKKDPPNPCTRIFDTPQGVTIRDTVEGRIGGAVDARHATAGQVSSNDIVAKQAALTKVETWVNTLSDDQIKTTYLCAITRFRDGLNAASAALASPPQRASRAIPLPPE